MFEGDLLGPPRHSAQRASDGRGGARERERALVVLLAPCQMGESFERARDPSLVPEAGECRQRAIEQCAGDGMITGLAHDMAPIERGSGDAPQVSQTMKVGDGLLVEALRFRESPLSPSHITHVIRRPGHASFVAEIVKEPPGLFEQRPRAKLIATQTHGTGEVAQRRGDLPLVPELSTDLETLLEKRLGGRIVADEPVVDGHRIQLGRHPFPITQRTKHLECLLVQVQLGLELSR